MRDLVFAMAHTLVAQAKRNDQLVLEHRRPELDVGGVLGRAPSMVAALGNPPRHRALDVDPPKILLARHPRDHAKIETPAGVTPRSDTHMRVERVVDVGRLARDLAYAVEHIGAALDGVPITDDRKNIFGAANEPERVRARCAEDGHAGAVRDGAPGEFARDARELARAPWRGDLAPCDALESGLRLRDVDVGREPQCDTAASRVCGWRPCRTP